MKPSRALLLVLITGGAAGVESVADPLPPAPAPAPPVDVAPRPLLDDVLTVDEHHWVESVTRRRQRLETAPQAVTVLSGPDLIDRPSVTLPDRLRYTAGIDVYQSRNGQFDVGLRGFNGINNGRIVAQVDGREFRWEAFGAVLWSGVLHASDISGVEIAKGPSSVGYGANAFGGVIVIKDREPDAQHRVYSVARAGTDRSYEADATALGPLGDRFYYKINAGATWLDDLDGPVGRETYTPHPRTRNSGEDDLRSQRYGGVLGWRITDDLRLEAEYVDIDLDQWEFVDDLDVGSNDTDWYFRTGSLRLIAPWGEIRHIRQYMDFAYSNQKYIYNPAADFRYTQAGFHDVVDTTRAQFNFDLPNHALSVGAEFYHWTSESNLWAGGGTFADEDSWDERSTTNRALFAEDQWSFAPRWLATAGLRVDDHSQAGVNLSPRVALNYVPDEDQFWLLSYAQGYRLPTSLETYIQEYYFRSDPELEAEKIQAVELGWQKRAWRDDLTIGINSWFSQSNDLIWILPLSGAEMQQNFNDWWALGNPDRNFVQPGPYFEFKNLDNPVDVWGTEASLEYHLPESPFTLWTNGTFQNYRYHRDVIYQSEGYDQFGTQVFAMDYNLGREVNAPPRWKASLGVNVDHGPWFASVAGRYVHHRRVFSFANSDFPNGELSVQDIPAYATLDCSIGLDFGGSAKRTRFVRLSVLDAFDAGHFEHYAASSSALFAANEQQMTSEIGRALTLQGGWEF